MSELLLNISKTPRKSIFYGWIIVTCAFVLLFLAFGSAYSFTTFFESLRVEFNATRSSISLVFSIAGFLYFAVGALSGQISDRKGPRFALIFGILVLGGGLLMAGLAKSIWQIYMSYGLGIGFGVGFIYVPSVSVVQRWFIRKRGFASGIAITGIGVGTMCTPPITLLLIEILNWRITYSVMGLVVIALGIPAAFLIVDSPLMRGLLPDGDGEPVVTGNGVNETPIGGSNLNRDITVREAIGTRTFRLLYIGSFSIALGLFIPFVHLVPFASDLGIAKSTGVLLFSLIGAGSTLGRFFIGGIADKFGRRASLAIMYGGMAAMFIWWLIATQVWELAIFAMVFGTCYGGYVALTPAVAADYFHGKNLSGIIGALYTSPALGVLIGPTLAGFAFDLRQSYTLPIILSACAAIVATFTTVLLKEPKRILIKKG